MLFIAAAFAAGIAVSGSMPAGFCWLAVVSVVTAASAFAAAGRTASGVLVMLAFVFAGAAVRQAHDGSITPERVRSIYDSGQIASGDPVEITGTVTGNIELAIDGFFVKVEVDSIRHRDQLQKASGTVRLFASVRSREMAEDYERMALGRGTQVRISCELTRDDEFRNPGVLPRKTILDWQDVDATGTIKSPLLVETVGEETAGVTDFIFDIREHLIRKFRELFSPQVAGVMIASLLGNKHFLDAGTAQVFREGGTFHILVISGLHITFIGGLAAMFVAIFTRRKGIQFLLVCGFLWSYTIAVGAEVPVVRASLMFTILWFSFVVHRNGTLANSLGTCGLILLAWRPNDLFGPSFQLTFVSVGAIVLAGFPIVSTLRAIGEWTPSSSHPFPARVPAWLTRVCETLYWNERKWEINAARNVWSANLFKAPYIAVPRTVQRTAAYLFEGILISTIVQIAMLPLVVHYFHRVTPVSILMNLWAGVFIALESFISLLAVLLSYISDALALPFVWLAEALHWLLIAGQFADTRFLSFRVPVYSGYEFWIYSVYFICIAVIAIAVFVWDPFSLRFGRSWSFANRRFIIFAGSVLLVFSGIIVFHPFSEPRADGQLHVEFLDVGQGDAIFITFPNGETMLVDAGGRTSYQDENDDAIEPDRPSIGESVVSEFLWEKGYSQIDHIVATHADADHIQGLADIARNFQIGEAWFGNLDTTDADVGRLSEILGRYRVTTKLMAAGDRVEIGGVTVEVLNPPLNPAGILKENDSSIVLRLSFGETSILLTGDIEEAAEAAVIASGVDLRSDVIKVPHHGSRTSSTEGLVQRVQPRFAIVPVGRRSMFGHPHSEVVERWRSSGAEVMTTGESGTISVVTDGGVVVVAEFVREKEKP